MLPNFVAKLTIARAACLELNGRLVLEDFSVLRAGLIAATSRGAAALFAEPVLTAKDDQIEVAWYSEQAGEPTPLDALDPDLRRIVSDKLTARLDALAPLLGSSLGPLLARAMVLASAQDILAVGQEPLLIRWGVLPDDRAADDQAGLDRHFAATLGRFATFGPPRIVPRPGAERPAPPPIAPIAPVPVRAEPVLDARPAYSRALLAATVAAAVLALVFGLPGILTRPAADDALTRARAATTALRDKVAQARAAAAAPDCGTDGPVAPDGTAPTRSIKADPPPALSRPNIPSGN